MTTDAERILSLEHDMNFLKKGIDEMSQDVREIKRILVGVDGENSLVNRVAKAEQKLQAHEDEATSALKEVQACLNPESIWDRPVKLKHLVIFGVLMFLINIPEVRHAIAEALSSILGVVPFIL
jgi:hypothetical protein